MMDLEIKNGISRMACSGELVDLLDKTAYACGQKLLPFGFFLSEAQRKANAVNILKIPDESGVPLVKQIDTYWREKLGVEDLSTKWVVIDYLLHLSACYIEVPKMSYNKGGMSTPTYEKFIATKNVSIIARWCGIDEEVAEIKYGTKLMQFERLSYTDDKIYLIKLKNDDKGLSPSVPRNPLAYDKMNVMPLFMIDSFVKGLKTVLSEKIVKFCYEKDNNSIRELCSTLSKEIYGKYYHAYPSFIEKTFYSVDIDTFKVDGLELSSTLGRGYIKIPEAGASIYDGTGCRSLNFIRLVSMEVVNEIDTTFIDVDLSAVLPRFIEALNSTALSMPNLMPKLYKDIVGEEPKSYQVPIMLEEMTTFINNRFMLLSTSYQRALHIYAITHANELPKYASEIVSELQTPTTVNVGVCVSDDF